MAIAAVIIGYCGQDGCFLWPLLEARGYMVHGIGRTSRKDGEQEVALKAPIVEDQTTLARYLGEINPDEIYYLAAYHHSSEGGPSRAARRELERTYAVNVTGFYNVLEASRLSCPSARIFYSASSQIFSGHDVNRLDELSEVKPTNTYGAAKATAVYLAREYRKKYRLYVSCGILFNHESHLRKPTFLSRRVIEGAAEIKHNRRKGLEIGNLSAVVDWSHAADFAEGFHALLQLERPDDYVFASGIERSVEDFARVAFGVVGLDWKDHVTTNYRLITGPSVRRIGDSSRLIERTGWTPRYNFEEMIAEIMSHFLETA